MMFTGKVCRLFISGTTVLSLGLALASASLMTGCTDSDKSGGQIEQKVDPAQKAKDSMEHYLKNDMKKAKQNPRR